MRKDLIVPDDKDEQFAMPTAGEVNTRVVTEPFTPLKDRIAKEHPEMLPSLQKLEELMGKEEFERHINTLQSIRRNATTVMLITERPLQKTNIEAKYLSHIEKAFDVNFVRIVCIG